MPNVKNDRDVEENLAYDQVAANAINDFLLRDRARSSGLDEIGLALKAEANRREKFNYLVNIGVIVSVVLYLALLVVIFSLFFYSVKLESFDLFNWKILSILGVVLGLPAAVILLSLAKLTSKPYRFSTKSDERDKTPDISSVPVVEASKDGMSIIKDLVSIIKDK